MFVIAITSASLLCGSQLVLVSRSLVLMETVWEHDCPSQNRPTVHTIQMKTTDHGQSPRKFNQALNRLCGDQMVVI